MAKHTEPRTRHHGTAGALPDTEWANLIPPRGDLRPWRSEPKGTVYTYIDPVTRYARPYTKVATGNDAWDWALGLHVISQHVRLEQFADDGAGAGALTLDEPIPAGAVVLRATVVGVEGFAGGTAASLEIGDALDADRYVAAPIDVSADADALDGGAPSGQAVHDADTPVCLTLTEGVDFADLTAGSLWVRIYMLA